MAELANPGVQRRPEPAAAVRSLGRALLALLVAMSVGTVACDGEISDNDLEKWTHNEVGLNRIAKVVQNPDQPVATRVRALKKVVEKGFPLRVRIMVEGIVRHGAKREQIPALQKEQAEIVRALTDELLGHIQKRSAFQLDAKDAVMSLSGFLSPEEVDRVHKVVAEWAFSDITWTSSPAEIKEKVRQRMYAGQIVDTGKYGWQTAAILISNGFLVDKMIRFLGSADSEIAQSLLYKALRTLHATSGVKAHELKALESTQKPEAVAYLLEVYMNTELDLEFRAAAFNKAISMVELDTVRKAPQLVIPPLMKLLQTDNAEDRWLAATNLVQLKAVDKLEDILVAFKDDKVYARAETDPGRSLQDLCLDIDALKLGDKAEGVFLRALRSPNRINQSIAIACLKALRSKQAAPQLRQLAALMTDPKADIDIHDFIGDDEATDPKGDVIRLTVGRFAQNALDGIALLDALEAARANKAIPEDQYRTKRLYTYAEFTLVGDAYKAAIESRLQDWIKEQAEEARLKKEAEEAEEAAKKDGAATEKTPPAPTPEEEPPPTDDEEPLER